MSQRSGISSSVRKFGGRAVTNKIVGLLMLLRTVNLVIKGPGMTTQIKVAVVIVTVAPMTLAIISPSVILTVTLSSRMTMARKLAVMIKILKGRPRRMPLARRLIQKMTMVQAGLQKLQKIASLMIWIRLRAVEMMLSNSLQMIQGNWSHKTPKRSKTLSLPHTLAVIHS